MKKTLRIVLALVLTLCMAIPAGLTAFAEDDSYYAFVAIGADAAASNDWGLAYYGAGSADNAGDITATDAQLKIGEPATISLEFANPVFYTWFLAPCVEAEGATEIDADVSLKIDGQDVDIDFGAGKSSWLEATGDYANTIRLAGGYNEWADKYIASPAGCTKIEYTITLKEIKTNPVVLEESDAVYDLFIAFGGDKEAENDWGLSYANGFVEGITAVNASVKSGETATVSLTFENPVVNAWYFAPTLVNENGLADVQAIDATIACKIDGQDVDIDLTQGDLWWTEGTGEYDADHAIRLAGGFNEWGAQYIAEPAGFTTIEYTITFNSIQVAKLATEIDSENEYTISFGYAGDKEASNDWGWSYDGTADVDGITATTATAKAGDTVTISLEFASAPVYTWYCCPTINSNGDDISSIDADITCKIDGQDVAIDFSQGDLWWKEGTGNADIRLAGGYNEWGAQYIASPADFTKLEYTITLKNVKINVAADSIEYDPTEDLAKDYNAYIQFQTDLYTFRNNWDDASYGLGTENFDVITAWDADSNEIRYAADYTDVVIDGDGTYTVRVDIKEDTNSLNGSTFYNMLEVSTDIPAALVDFLEISDVKTSFDGGSDKAYGIAVANGDYLTIEILNTYGDSGTDAIAYEIPAESIAITFTVSGFGREGTGSAADVAEPDDVVAPAEEEGGVNAVAIACAAGGVVVVAAAATLIALLAKKKGKKSEDAAAEEAAEKTEE